MSERDSICAAEEKPLPKKGRSRAADLTGLTFGDLTVLQYAMAPDGKWKYRCRCKCGKETMVAGWSLTRKAGTKSCGCSKAMMCRLKATKHGMNGTVEYRIWSGMRTRCRPHAVKKRPRYGSVKVCERWNSFENFFADMGPRPTPRHSIGRIDNDGDYEPSNCRWETPKEQGRNKSSTVRLTIDGVTKPLVAWSEQFGISIATIWWRLRSGWDAKRACTQPLRGSKPSTTPPDAEAD
jgi:hypothetical protein